MECDGHDYSYTSMSIASLGASTLPDAKIVPRVVYLEKPAQVFGTGESKRALINRPNFSDVSDIAGARPKPTHVRSVERNPLSIDDIEGAKARYRDRFFDTKRNVDPLQPEYKLPSYKISPIEPPKFVKDPLSIDDISGTRTRQKKLVVGRDTMSVDDIEGAKAGWKPRHMQVRVDTEPRDVLYVTEDLKKKKFQDRTSRKTDPTCPIYNIYGMEITDDAMSKPKKSKAPIADNSMLRTDDVYGARPGQCGTHSLSLPMDRRKEFRNTNFLGDIPGAQSDTIKHSIVTKRSTNPLAPLYQSLDDGAPLNGPNEPLIPPHMVDTKTSFKIFGSNRDLIPMSTNQRSAQSGANSRRNSSSTAFEEADQNFQPLGSGSNTSQYLGESKSYAEKLDNGDLLQTASSYLDETQPRSKPPSHGSSLKLDISGSAKIMRPERIETFSSRQSTNRSHSGSNAGSARSSPHISSGMSTPYLRKSGQSSPMMSDRSTSLSSRRAMAELEAEVHAIRSL